jgi:threonine/homoserine/homoserine lactone efflux protein
VPTSSTLFAFVAAALVLLVIPGPAVLYIVARSVSQGRRAGLVSVLGISVGVLVHIIAATAGLSAVLFASAAAFGVVKLMGAGYLIYLGVRTLLAPVPAAGVDASDHRSLRCLFADGILVCVLNPKTGLFFLAFLPQFVEPGRGPVPQQVLVLGLVFLALAFLSDGTYALLAGCLRRRLGGRIAQGPLPRYLSGGLYIGLGVSTALMGRRHA